MKYWLVLHDFQAYREQPRLVGKDIRLKGKIDKIKKGDKVLYYATGDSAIIGAFDVTSNGFIYNDEPDSYEKWTGEIWAYKIRPITSKKHDPAPVSDLRGITTLAKVDFLKWPPIRFRGRTAIEITPYDFKSVEKELRKFKDNTASFFQGAPNESQLGEPLDLGIINYAPTSEQGVVILFAHFMTQLPHNFVKIEFVRSAFPDACVLQKIGRTYERKYVEFEFRSSQFKDHIRNPKHKRTKCDFLVCWEHDYALCPKGIKVIELKSEIQNLQTGKKVA